ncbi:hypothetical protein IFM89_020009, partial [Coptis chinensis]
KIAQWAQIRQAYLDFGAPGFVSVAANDILRDRGRLYCDELRRVGGKGRVNCRKSNQEDGILSVSQAYDVLGVTRNCSFIELKTAFRSIVKQFHPDVRKDSGDTDIMIRRVIKAYKVILPASLILPEIFCKSPCPYNSCQLFKYCNCFGNLFS